VRRGSEGPGPGTAARRHVLGRRRQPDRRRRSRVHPSRRRHRRNIIRLRVQQRAARRIKLGHVQELIIRPQLPDLRAHVQFRRRPGHLGRVVMHGITSGTALWYASRAAGVVSLVLLSAVMILGLLVNRQGRLPGLPRFAVLGLHRNLSLLAVAFIAVHVLSAVAASFVSISLAAAPIPFVSPYPPFWLRLGAASLHLIAAP